MTDTTSDTVSQLMVEGALPLPKLVELLTDCAPVRNGVKGKPPTVATLTRWITQGKHKVKLLAYSGYGQGWCTSLQALARFYAALTRRHEAGHRPGPIKVRQRQSKAAGEELARLRRTGK
jgi:hypothetical protein